MSNIQLNKRWKIYFDGNKTPQGVTCSYLIVNELGEKIKETTLMLPKETTVPEAEYYGLIYGIENILTELCPSISCSPKEIELEIYGDSQLVIRQINGDYECKKPQLRVLRSKVRTLLEQFSSYNLTWVPREKNLVR